MSLLQPWYIPMIAAGLAIPPLVLLYFLKLRRREVPIASTLLWKRAVQDLQVNSPFQRLRSNLLLILQLLILLAAIAAIAEPVMNADRDFEESIVLLIDHSASMATVEEEGRTRLEDAKAEALKVIEDMSKTQRAMVIAFADRARVLTPLTDDKKKLRRLIESIEQTDAIGQLAEAIALAEAHSTPVGEKLVSVAGVSQSDYMLFTDARLTDADEVQVRRGVLEVFRIGASTENVGIVNLDVRRNYERPEQLNVLARVRNFGSASAERDVSLYVDGQLKAVQPMGTLAPLGEADQLGTLAAEDIPPEGSETTVPFDLILDTAARVEVRLSGRDALTADDRAFAVVTPPQAMSVLLVTSGNRFLRQLLPAMPLSHYETWTPDEYEEAPDEKLVEDGRCKFDVVIMDGCDTARLPPGSYIFLAGIPLIDSVDSGQRVCLPSMADRVESGECSQTGLFLDWDETHPILRHVSVEAMTVVSWLDLTLPDRAVLLIEATNGPVMALLHDGRQDYLISAFGLFNANRTQLDTDWVFQEGFVVFFYNALRYLSGNAGIGQIPSVSPGEAFTVAAKPDASSVKVRRPNGDVTNAPVRADGLAAFGQTDQVGLYTIDGAVADEDARAVNLCSDAESFVAPNKEFRIAVGETASSESVERVNQPLWPYILAALGVLLFAEWFVYNKRVFI